MPRTRPNKEGDGIILGMLLTLLLLPVLSQQNFLFFPLLKNALYLISNAFSIDVTLRYFVVVINIHNQLTISKRDYL